ncbi:MAG: hypothetical protein K1X52_13230 [Pyrinomonadaceae bacterium]|nr:hypothetical protein [Pyrinomonadaceae bacterium]
MNDFARLSFSALVALIEDSLDQMERCVEGDPNDFPTQIESAIKLLTTKISEDFVRDWPEFIRKETQRLVEECKSANNEIAVELKSIQEDLDGIQAELSESRAVETGNGDDVEDQFEQIRNYLQGLMDLCETVVERLFAVQFNRSRPKASFDHTHAVKHEPWIIMLDYFRAFPERASGLEINDFNKLRIDLIRTRQDTHKYSRVAEQIEELKIPQKYDFCIEGHPSRAERLKQNRIQLEEISPPSLRRQVERQAKELNTRIEVAIQELQKRAAETTAQSLAQENPRLSREIRANQERRESQLSKDRPLLIGRLRRRLERGNKVPDAMAAEFLDFEVFPRGQLPMDSFSQILRKRGIPLTPATLHRLNQIEKEFTYDVKCIGKNGFNGYIIYRFLNSNIVIAEKPIYGNATYLVRGEWEEVKKILKLSRWEARTHYNKQVKRIIHYDEIQWLSELRHSFHYWH